MCIVTGSSVFWDFGSLHLKASRRPTGQLLRQRHTQRKTLRRPCHRLLRQRQTQQVRRCGVKELKLVLRMEFSHRSHSEDFCGEFRLAACTDEIQIVSMLSVPPPFHAIA